MLSRNILPVNYNLSFNFDLQQLNYKCEESILIDIKEPVDEIILHCMVKIPTVVLDDTIYSDIEYFDEKIKIKLNGYIDGTHYLYFNFDNIIPHERLGLYYSVYNNEIYIGTMSEATFARYIFPCFDEPIFKATYDINIEIPEHLTGLSNSEAKNIEYLDSRKKITFETTFPMSTYLISIIIGKFDYVGRDNVRVYVPPDKKGAEIALDIACSCIKFYTEFTNVKLPLTKINLVAVPGFDCVAPALESWGNIIYFFDTILFQNNNINDKYYVVNTIAHELAHQWFGDLVSIEWWDDVYLKEALSQYVSFLATENYFNEKLLFQEYFWGINDSLWDSSLPVIHEVDNVVQINENYSSITYYKGGSIFRMIHYLIGDKFNKVLNQYLTTYAFKNANTKDFLNILKNVTSEFYANLMLNWLTTKYVPILIVEDDFVHLYGNFIVPFIYKSNNETKCTFLTQSTKIDLSLVDEINPDNIVPMVIKSNKINMVLKLESEFYLSYHGFQPMENFFEFISDLKPNSDPYFWNYLFSHLETLKDIYEDKRIKYKIITLISEYYDKLKPIQDKLVPKTVKEKMLKQIQPVDTLTFTKDLRQFYCIQDDIKTFIKYDIKIVDPFYLQFKNTINKDMEKRIRIKEINKSL